MRLSPSFLTEKDKHLMALPEKVLQFGTGVLLRALPDHFIDKANKQGIFNGRVVVVKSTPGDTEAFTAQQNLYTICVRGIDQGKPYQEDVISAAISRVLSAGRQWPEILQCARDPGIKIILSNTTEVGIRLTEDDPFAQPPSSFPGRLLALLWERWQHAGRQTAEGFIIIPTELIPDNGGELRRIVLELARRNHLDEAFISWVQDRNRFCNSLVDRIVPGRPAPHVVEQLGLPYEDALLTMAEPFRLWAIEGDAEVQEALSFAKADEGMVITPDIRVFHERKLRLLNGTHSFCCGPAFLSGFSITREAMLDKDFRHYMQRLLHEEIARAIPMAMDPGSVTDYIGQVMDRFANPHIDHAWLSISLQYSSKMRLRNLPLLQTYYARYQTVPLMMAAGFAGYILFMKPHHLDEHGWQGMYNGKAYPIKDDKAALFHEWWANLDADQLTDAVLGSETLWGTDLRALPGFRDAVAGILKGMLSQGVYKTLIQVIGIRS